MTANIIKTKGNGTSNTPASSFTGLVDQFFQDNLNRFLNDEFWGFRGLSQNSVPVNIQETNTSFEMDLFAPGLKKEDFHLNVTDDMLIVSYERQESSEQNINWLRQEYRANSFSRSFNLDESIDINKISANYNNGILHLSIPKKENAQRLVRKIDIQ